MNGDDDYVPRDEDWKPLPELRWYRPRGGGDWETHLQQRFQLGGEKKWRNVPTIFATD